MPYFFAECVASYYPVQLLLIPCFHFLCRHTILYPCTLQHYTIPYKQYLARSTIYATFSQGPPAKLSILRNVCPLSVYSIAYMTSEVKDENSRKTTATGLGILAQVFNIKAPGGNFWTQHVELPVGVGNFLLS